jgi:hypothetical protein
VPTGTREIGIREIALLSQEGSGIAKRIPRGVVPKPPSFKVVACGTTPALRATPPFSSLLRPVGLAFAAAHDSEGEFIFRTPLSPIPHVA